MKFVFLGLSLSSSWGNGHATTYRCLLRALSNRGHDVTFLERDMPWYASNRDLVDPDYCTLAFYDSVRDLKEKWSDFIIEADAVILGSYVPEGITLGKWITRDAQGVPAFYDIDTPITISALENGKCEYLSRDLIPRFDLYLSFSGGPILEQLMNLYGAPRAEAFYCSVDPDFYKAVQIGEKYQWNLGYLGTYSPDRQAALDKLLITTAEEMPENRFAIAGALYPSDVYWPKNIRHFEHLSPKDHPAFYADQRYALNITREPMVKVGYSPSVRLFEAAACGTPIISDWWEGLDEIFTPDEEILIAQSTSDVRQILVDISDVDRRTIGLRARDRVLKSHTSKHRAEQLEVLVRTALFNRMENVAELSKHSEA